MAGGRALGAGGPVPKAAEAKIAEAAPLRGEGCEATRQMTVALPLTRWRGLGVTTEGRAGAAGSPSCWRRCVRAGSRSFLVYHNYESLLGYNCAHAYALSVALLSDRVAAK